MKKSIKKRWVAALRSGKYRKGKNSLKTAHGNFCCLGVLTDLYAREKKIPFQKLQAKNDAFLCAEVRKWAGLTSSDPRVQFKGQGLKELAYINDDTKSSFKDIATLINKHL